MANKNIKITIKSALDAAGIHATNQQLDTVAKKVDDFNKKTKQGADEASAAWTKLPGPLGKIQSALGGVGATAMAVIGAFKLGWDIGTWINDKVIKPLFNIKDANEELIKQNRRMKAERDNAQKAWEEQYQEWAKNHDASDRLLDREIKKIDRLTRSYLELQAAKKRSADAGNDARVLALERDKFSRMSKADSPEVAAAIGKDYDIRIAEAQLKHSLAQFDVDQQNAAKELENERRKKRQDERRMRMYERQKADLEKQLKYWEQDGSAIAYGTEHSDKNEKSIREEIKKQEEKMRVLQAELDGRREHIAALEESAKAAPQERANMEERGLLDIDRKNKEYADYIRETMEKDRKKAEEEAKSEEKSRIDAERKIAAERAKIEAQEAVRRERERQQEIADRIKEHERLLAAERSAELSQHAAVSAADAKLQQAWGWYRNKDSMAAQIAEEKADAEARKQFEKDLDRLKTWRRDWRTAENLSVDEEAVRRVALAREEKEAAEKHLAQIEENTAELAAKLDELLQIKG